MKNGLLLFLLLTTFNVFGQTNKEIKVFAQEYFAHYKQRDFDWIKKRFASKEDYKRRHKSYNYPNPSTDEKLDKNYGEIQQWYFESLIENTARRDVLQKTSFVEVLITTPHALNEHEKGIKIIFKDEKGKLFYLIPGYIWLNTKNKAVVFGAGIDVYNHRPKKRAVEKPDYRRKSSYTIKGDSTERFIGDNPIFKFEEAPTQPKPKPDNKGIFNTAEVMPEFTGGQEALNKYMGANIEYPQIALDNKIGGQVIMQFVVNIDGSLSDCKIMQDIGGGCGMQVLKAVKQMPKWKPGKQNGKPVPVRYTLPWTFIY